MAQEGKGRRMRKRFCPHVQDTLKLPGRHFLSSGGATIQALFAVNHTFRPKFFTFFAIMVPWRRGEREGRVPLVSPWAGDMDPSWDNLFTPRCTTTQAIFSLDHTFWPRFPTFPTLGTMVRGGHGGARVQLMSPHLASCGEYGDTKFFHGVNPRYQFRREILTLLGRWLALGAMAQEGKGRGRGNRWCPHVQDTLNFQGRRFFFRGGTTIQKLVTVYCKKL
jgi:hypothetical protein